MRLREARTCDGKTFAPARFRANDRASHQITEGANHLVGERQGVGNEFAAVDRGASAIIGMLALFVKLAARRISEKFEFLEETINEILDDATREINAYIELKFDGAVQTITSDTAAMVDGAEKLVEATVAGAVQTIRSETAAKIDGAVREIKAYVDGVIMVFKAEARGERKIQEIEMERLKRATEENKRDIRNLESVVYRGEKRDGDGGGENLDAPKPGYVRMEVKFRQSASIERFRPKTAGMGTEFEIPFATDRGEMTFRPGLSVAIPNTDGSRFGESDLDSRGRFDFGVDYSLGDGVSLGFQSHYTGLDGESEFESCGAGLGLRKEF